MNNTTPTIFISSTFYDLKQIRMDIKDAIESLNYTAMISEHNSFPINPDLDIISNCIQVVDKCADILILIIGGRYGEKLDSGISITNHEYNKAKIKGIPIYAFVDKSVHSNLSSWKDNKMGDFSSVVDSNKIFEFIEEILKSKEQWVFPFEMASDIVDTIKKQFAFLFQDSLELRRKINMSKLQNDILSLSPNTSKIAIEKPVAWEHRLFSQILSDEIDSTINLKRDLDFGISIGKKDYINEIPKLNSWIQMKLAEVINLLEIAATLMNKAYLKAIGKPGEPGDVEYIIYVAKRLGAVYIAFLKWSIDVRKIAVIDEYQTLMESLVKVSSQPIKDIDEFNNTLKAELKRVIPLIGKTEGPITVKITCRFKEPDMKSLISEIERLTSKI